MKKRSFQVSFVTVLECNSRALEDEIRKLKAQIRSSFGTKSVSVRKTSLRDYVC